MQIPDDKRYFRIGEVSRIIGVKPYVLRYWESEFSQIRPTRADSKQRVYQKRDLELIMEIKRLLYDEKLTIEGAKKRLRAEKHLGSEPAVDPQEMIKNIKKELQNIIEELG
jgi:DNA-binding transcriptional MerR regulator